MTKIIGVRFREVGKIYYFAPGELDIKVGDKVIVETSRGLEYGNVVLGSREVSDESISSPLKSVIRMANAEDRKLVDENRRREGEAFKICKAKIMEHALDMKLISAEYTFDRVKLLFYFTAEGRVDFRELVKDLASIFKVRIELRQVGVRDETKIVGGIGSCGRPLCCHSYLSDFVPVSIKMAKEQNLSLNPQKISGVCGRLMCCLKNEADTYAYLNANLPKEHDRISTKQGVQGVVSSVNILRQTVKLLVDKEGDEKELAEYHISELKFKARKQYRAAELEDGLEDLDVATFDILDEAERAPEAAEAAEEPEVKKPKKNFKKKYNKNRPKHSFKAKE